MFDSFSVDQQKSFSCSFLFFFPSWHKQIHRSAGSAKLPEDKLKVTHRPPPHTQTEIWTANKTSTVNTRTHLQLAGCNVWVDSLTFHGHYLSLRPAGEVTHTHAHRGLWVVLTHNLSRYEREMTRRWEAEEGEQQWCISDGTRGKDCSCCVLAFSEKSCDYGQLWQEKPGRHRQ